MPTVEPTMGLLAEVPPALLAWALALAATLLLVIAGRRLTLLCFALQYPLFAALALLDLYRPLALVMTGLGLAVAAIFYVTAAYRQPHPEGQQHRSLAAMLRASHVGDMGLGFRLVAAVFAAFVVYGLARAYPLPNAPHGTGFVYYQLIVVGLLTALTSVDPLRRGYGLLTLLRGFQGIYLLLEQSFLVLSLWSFVEIITALAIAYFGQLWLDSAYTEREAE
ncbi:MAG: hypothetical protein V1772_11715 [Chloroflexota bacterium]